VSRRGGEPDLDRLVVPLRDRAGRTAAWIAAVPFLRASETGAGSDDSIAEGTRRFFAAVFERARALRGPGEAIVAAGHLYLVGGRTSELSERKLVAGHQSAVPVDVFPGDLAYVALGHLHLAQAVGGRESVRYSGSLLPLSLAERGYPHQVVLVDLEGERASRVRSLRVPRFVDIVRVPATGSAPVEEVLAALRELPARGDGPDVTRPFLEVEVAVDGPEPSLRERVEAVIEGKEARLVRLGVASDGSGLALGDVEARPIAELAPEEVFRRKYEREYGGAPPPEILGAFLELERALREEAA
jgi:exonuclease SbcD